MVSTPRLVGSRHAPYKHQRVRAGGNTEAWERQQQGAGGRASRDWAHVQLQMPCIGGCMCTGACKYALHTAFRTAFAALCAIAAGLVFLFALGACRTDAAGRK